ncbi:MAG: tRNA lysidine(34) synthetase TilS [Flavisolibacter sp.]
MDLLNHFLQKIKQHGSPARVVVAVSGGVDSVVLADLCHRAEMNFVISHCNFQLRGEESQRDEDFVKSLADRYGIPFFLKKFDTKKFAAENKLSVQETARVLRYGWFEEVLNQTGAAFTLLAHHADDNIETLLMNFFRGTGLDGLTGMPEKNAVPSKPLRPLLQLRRSEIVAYAQERKLAWVEDSSNLSIKYTRNYFRNELLPALKKVYPQADENLLRNIERLKETNRLYQTMLAEFKQKFCIRKGEELHVPVLKLQKFADSSLVYEIIRDYGFTEGQVPEVMKLSNAESGKYIANESYQVIRHRHWLVVAPLVPQAETRVLEREEDFVVFAGGRLSWKTYDRARWKLNTSNVVAQLDAAKVEWPLLLRRRKMGDYFYPLGLHKKKKLSRFFIDNKLSKSDKENIWVLESHKRIIWIAGHRIDDRFKVTDSTKTVLEITLTNP